MSIRSNERPSRCFITSCASSVVMIAWGARVELITTSASTSEVASSAKDRELAHLPGSYQQNARLIEVGKELPGQSYRDMAHRSCTAADAGLAAGTLACHEGSAKQRRRNRASEITVLGSF